MIEFLELDRAAMAADFPRNPFAISHGLAGHPLLKRDALVMLAERMAGDRIEYNSGRLIPGQGLEDTPHIDMDAGEVISRIEDAGAWLVLKNVETEPAYRVLVEQALLCAARAQGHDTLADADMLDPQGFIFVSSANSVTPFHVDYEQNFFVHLHGASKAMHIFDNEDRSLVCEGDLETFPGKHRNLAYDPAFEERARVYEFTPGDGVFLPYCWPHWVRTGPQGYSISMAITWKTRDVIAMNRLRFANAVLRKFGLPQAEPGRQPMFDGIKIATCALARALIEPLRHGEASRAFLRRLLFGRRANYFYRRKVGAGRPIRIGVTPAARLPSPALPGRAAAGE